VELKLKQFKEASEIIILYDIEELTVLLDESLAKATNIISNRYIGPLRERAEKIQNDIILGQEIVEKIVECQRKWVYLENIFAAQDIKKQLMV
jgi:dynein heavy chain